MGISTSNESTGGTDHIDDTWNQGSGFPPIVANLGQLAIKTYLFLWLIILLQVVEMKERK